MKWISPADALVATKREERTGAEHAARDLPKRSSLLGKVRGMFWQNDGSQDAARFAQQRVLTGSSLLFDDQCLADVDAITGGP